ncbi:MAG: hypothetical protein KH745_01710 [Bilophila sp.]|nr:hypothetical protein [Bilophila sp.]
MVSIIQGILILFGTFAAFEAFLTYQNAQSAMHQIYAGTWFIVLAVCVAGIGIIQAISNLKDKNTESEPKA